MSEVADRYRKVAAGFTKRAEAVPAEGWDNATPCKEWVARDIVSHLCGVTARFASRGDVVIPPGPSADDDPVAAWVAARDAMQAALDDPAVATKEFESPMGPTTLEQFVGMFGVGDLLIHTWDLARATGQDDTLDADEVRRLYDLMEPRDEMMR